jgi:fluoroquinolone resistance protein
MLHLAVKATASGMPAGRLSNRRRCYRTGTNASRPPQCDNIDAPLVMTTTMEQLFEGESFDDETIVGFDLAGANLADKLFAGCTFRNVKLAESRWSRARLEDCVLEGCDLTRLAPAEMALRGVQFNRCKMMGIDWTGVGEYPDLGFADCNLDYCSFTSLRLRKTSFVRCSLIEASFVDADLTEARFDSCRFTGARFERCDLRKASFGGSQDLLLDPATNQVRGTSIPAETALLLAVSFGFKVTP